jgi:hypothetical protein
MCIDHEAEEPQRSTRLVELAVFIEGPPNRDMGNVYVLFPLNNDGVKIKRTFLIWFIYSSGGVEISDRNPDFWLYTRRVLVY